MNAERICSKCERTFVLTPDKPGRINECPDCGRRTEVPRVQGITVVEGKNATYTQVVTAAVAAEFRRLSRVGSVLTH